jgi:DUF971 family protein
MSEQRAIFKLRNIAVAEGELALAWGDGHESYIPFKGLREACPCAFCTAGKGSDPNSAAEMGSDPIIKALLPVGAYAVQIAWSDGHDTGIYTFENLRRMCGCVECRQ